MEGFRLVESSSVLSTQHIGVQMIIWVPGRSVKESRVLHEPRSLGIEARGRSDCRRTYFLVVVRIKINRSDS